ncbi:UNVERIFIED_CONTAM: hypothetical protein Sradi_0685200 [Sesamum radiatum]|uniref:RNase H type-1 domain-containing protein n=1 Tax=Sesamum radiatum TaxID=300843 RepID=A0AAW2VR75_SESRA
MVKMDNQDELTDLASEARSYSSSYDQLVCGFSESRNRQTESTSLQVLPKQDEDQEDLCWTNGVLFRVPQLNDVSDKEGIELCLIWFDYSFSELPWPMWHGKPVSYNEEVSKGRPWLLHVEKSSTTQGSGAGVVLTTPQGDDMEFAIKFDFKASNNEAEYEALVLGMKMAQDVGVLHLLAYSDSQLIVKQVNKEYEAKEESMVHYLQQIEELKTKFKSFQLQQIPREENVKADSLSKLANALEDCKTCSITVQHLPQPRIPLDVQPIHHRHDWRMPITRWINEGHLSGNRWKATKIKTRAIRFLTQGGILYTKSSTHPLL